MKIIEGNTGKYIQISTFDFIGPIDPDAENLRMRKNEIIIDFRETSQVFKKNRDGSYNSEYYERFTR